MAEAKISYETRNCKNCGQSFSFPQVGRGLARLHCSPTCASERARTAFRERPRAVCIVDGCSDVIARPTTGLCEKHYMRLRRNGTYEVKPRRDKVPTSHGYMTAGLKGHPLCGNRGYTYEHRLVLYEHIGPGAHPCFWCGQQVEWLAKGKRKLVVDHFDGDKTNNIPTNLLPSCHRCNSTRGMFEKWVREHKDDPFLWSLFERQQRAA